MGEAFITFCVALDGLLHERARLMAIKVVTVHGGKIHWLQEFFVNRALARNRKQIATHECALYQRRFAEGPPRPMTTAFRLMEEELGRLHERMRATLRQEIEIDGLLD